MADSKSRSKAGLERREAEEALKAFLDSENEARVFALKGDWGVGKTHLVKTFLLGIEKEYYYSSVFGISSIDELKMQLWSNFQPVKKEEKNGVWERLNTVFRGGVKNTKENLASLEKFLEIIPGAGKAGGVVTSSVISLISNMLINSMLKGKLICIDDIERKSKSLRLDDLLGFIESLAEEHECKVVIIFNEDKIDETGKNNLNEYREKVIDIEIKLNPSADENFYIGFGENDPDEKLILNCLRRENIQTNNIRILRKLRWILDQLRPYIKDFLPSVRHKILQEIIFVSLAKFDRTFPVDLDKLLSLGDYSTILASKNNEDKNLYLSAISLGYSESSISDEIIRLVETSICNYQKFSEAAKQLNDREKQNKIREKLQEAYSPYSESFALSEEELCKNLTDFLDECCIFLDLHEIVDLEEIAQAINLDLSSYKRNWLKSKIDSSHTLSSLNSLNNLKSLFQEFPNLISELEQKIKSIEETMSITQLLSKPLKNRDWSEEEVDYLNRRTVEDYKNWLLERHPEKYYMVKQGLKMEDSCSLTIKQAIKELAQQSKLNAIRAKKLYNIDIET